MEATIKAAIFNNCTDKTFIGQWAGVKYTFKKGTQSHMEEWKARHFAKHLANRELNELDIRTDDPSRAKLIAKFVLSDDAEEEMTEEELKTNLANRKKKDKKPFCTKCDSKGVTHKKECPTNDKEPEFPDLNK